MKNKKSISFVDATCELMLSCILLTICSVVAGKFFSAPLGNILMMGAGCTLAVVALPAIICLVCIGFSRVEELRKSAEPMDEETGASPYEGWIIRLTVAYIVFWVLMFIVFPEDTCVGEFIRQWKQFG